MIRRAPKPALDLSPTETRQRPPERAKIWTRVSVDLSLDTYGYLDLEALQRDVSNAPARLRGDHPLCYLTNHLVVTTDTREWPAAFDWLLAAERRYEAVLLSLDRLGG